MRSVMARVRNPDVFVTNFNSYLIQLLKITLNGEMDLSTNGLQQSTLTLEEMVKITQEKWLRPVGSERWNLKDSSLLKVHRTEIIRLLKKMGFVNEIKPSLKNYDAILVLGISDKNLITRINYIKKIYQEGIQYKKIYLLSGKIKIRPNLKEMMNIDSLHFLTEISVMDYLCKKLCISLKQPEMPIVMVVAKKKKNRPNTADTLQEWLAKNDAEKNILIISNQPFVRYQKEVVKRVLKTSCNFDTVGAKMDLSIPIAVILDTVARYLYECNLTS